MGARRQDESRRARVERHVDRHGQGGARGAQRVRSVRRSRRTIVGDSLHPRRGAAVPGHSAVSAASRVQLEGIARVKCGVRYSGKSSSLTQMSFATVHLGIVM